MRLRYVGNLARKVATGHLQSVFAIQGDTAAKDWLQAEDALEKRRLPDAVGAEQTHHASRNDIDVEVLEHAFRAISDRSIAHAHARCGLCRLTCGTLHSQSFLPLNSAHKNSGAPIIAVTTESGSSVGQARAQISTRTMKAAPPIIALGSSDR